MSMFDGILKSIAGSPDDVVNLARSLGIDPKMTEMAIAALARAHPAEGDTLEVAAAETGMDTGTLGQIVAAIGGEGSLTSFANMIGDGDSPLKDIAGIAGKFFGKN